MKTSANSVSHGDTITDSIFQMKNFLGRFSLYDS